MNKYRKWHDEIIDKARLRSVIPVLYEKHHIIPRCLGGTNKKTNLVCLTLREHVIIHLLLTKMYTGIAHQKMVWAFLRTSKWNNEYVSSRTFEKLRKERNEILRKKLTGKKQSPETIAKRVNVRKVNGTNNHSFEAKTNMKIAAQNRKRPPPFSIEHKTNLSKKGKGRIKSLETRQKLSIANKGKKLSDESIQKRTETRRNIQKIECYRCNKSCYPWMHKRWHGINCKV